ncbi:hypothetical protein HDU93_000432, partial [Gonapodya sp. JEL0774]
MRSSDVYIDDTEPITAVPTYWSMFRSTDQTSAYGDCGGLLVHQKPTSSQQINCRKQPGTAPAALGTGKVDEDDVNSFDLSGLSLTDEIKQAAQEQSS